MISAPAGGGSTFSVLLFPAVDYLRHVFVTEISGEIKPRLNVITIAIETRAISTLKHIQGHQAFYDTLKEYYKKIDSAKFIALSDVIDARIIQNTRYQLNGGISVAGTLFSYFLDNTESRPLGEERQPRPGFGTLQVMEPEAAEDEGASRAEPGASRHGNFINYYQFHPAEERVRQLPRAVCRPGRHHRKYLALDVGCNSGELTLGLHAFLSENLPDHEVSVLGVDLDEVLIARARERNDRPESVSFECLDFFSEERKKVTEDFLKKHQAERFDTSFCFSITMWVHLNRGDEGLRQLLGEACAMSDAVLVEPQPWRCYRAAARRLRRAGLGEFPLLPSLELRGDTQTHIEGILERCGFHKRDVTDANEWQRRLLLYERVEVDA